MEEHYEATFDNAEALRNALSARRFEACAFRGVQVTEQEGQALDFRGVRFEDCVFEDCDLSNVPLRDAAFRAVRFVRCKLAGWRWDEVQRMGFAIDLVDAQLDFGVFAAMDLRDSSATDSRFQECDFSGAQLEGFVPKGCDFRGAVWTGANCRKVDFRAAEHVVMNPAEVRLRGALFMREQLEGLLAHVGLHVEP